MALTTEQQIKIRNRIADALEVALKRRSDDFNNGKDDNAYRAGAETALLYYEKYVEKFFGISTLDFERTWKDVNKECEFWEDVINKLP